MALYFIGGRKWKLKYLLILREPYSMAQTHIHNGTNTITNTRRDYWEKINGTQTIPRAEELDTLNIHTYICYTQTQTSSRH